MNVTTDSLFLSHTDPMWVYDLETLRFLAVNNAAIAKYGYSRAEFLAMTIADIRPPEDLDALKENVAAMVDGRNEAGVWRHCLKSGEMIYVDITGHSIDFEGRSAELIASRDVSRLVLLEQAAKQALEREEVARRSSDTLARQFQMMFNSVPGIFVVCSPEQFDIVAASEAFLHAVGVSRGDLVGRNLFEALPAQPDDMLHAGLRASCARVLASNEPDILDVQRFSLLHSETAGHENDRFWAVSTSPVTGPDGCILYLMLRLLDVTVAVTLGDGHSVEDDISAQSPARVDLVAHTRELKSDNLRLAELATKLRATQRLLDTGTWDYVLEEDRLIWSSNVYDMYGVTPVGFEHGFEDYVALVHPDDRAPMRANFEDFIASNETHFSFAHQIQHADGRVVHVHGVAEKMATANGPVLSGVVQNVTESVEASRTLIQANRLLEIAGTAANFGAWRYDVLLDRLEWSPQTARIHDEPEGFHPSIAEAVAYYAPEHRNKITSVVQSCINHGQPFSETLQILTAKGRRRWVRATGEPERDAAGRIITIQGAFQDISELIDARQKADELNSQLADTLENIGDAFFTVDLDWRISYLNSRAEALLERPRQTLIGKKIFDEFPEVRGTDFEAKFIHASKTGETVRFEHFFNPLDRTLRVNAYPTPTSLAVYFTDISKERRSQEQLRLLNAAVSRINDIVIITEVADPPRIVYVNDAFERRSGYTREEAIGQSPRIVYGPRTQESEVMRIRDALLAFTPVRAELINYTKTGEEYWLDIDAVPLADEDGTYTHFVAIERDITDRRRTEKALRLSEARFAMVARATGNAIWEWDIVENRLWWSEGFAEIFGHQVEPEENVSAIWRANIHPDDEAETDKAIEGLVSGKTEGLLRRYRFRRGDGSWAHVEDRAFAIRDEEGRATRILGSVTDISERLLLEDRLRQSQKLEAVGHLTGGVAHDFNNLLTVIVGNNEVLRDELGEGHRLRPNADMSMAAAERAATLISRLLAFSRKQPLDPRVLDLNAVIGGIDAMLRRTLGEDVNIEVVRAGGLWRTEVDLGQFETALLNLVINARDAMPDGGALTIETANASLDDIDVATDPDLESGQYVVVAISDTGHGIPRDEIDRVFEPYFTTKPMGKGTGLGLSMVYGFVKQSGGHIRIYSEPGEGTTVKLYFPRFKGDQPEESVLQKRTQPLRGHETILVVEDDDLILDQLEAQLSSLGYKVLTASEGPSALAILRERSDIDLLFTDVVLPGGMNGRVIADTARTIRPGIRILYTSGYSENAIVHHGRLDPGVELLSKPYRRADLAAKVRKVLES